MSERAPVELHVMQASLQFSDPRAAVVRDLDTIYSRGADVIGHTEAGHFHELLKAACKRHGYRLVQPKYRRQYIGTCFAVRDEHILLDSSYLHIIDAVRRPARLGGHGPHGITTVELDVAGERVHLSECHVLTGWGQSGRAPEREGQILKQWRVTTATAAQLGKGFDLSVLLGDVNYDPDDQSPNTPSRILRKQGWTSVFDEAGTPDLPTHEGGRTIDQIYTLDRDPRVSVHRVKVWRDRTAIDHQQVSAWLHINPRKRDQ
jgi:endonuclease/exonuclease/phosphatase family metal-dependent hydrolase